MPQALDRPPIPTVLAQHAEDCASLRETRAVLVRAPNVGLLQLGRLDERLRAHLDGLAVAGEDGVNVARQALETPGAGSVFTATLLALAADDPEPLAPLAALARSGPDPWRGFVSALGWVAAHSLRAIAGAWLASPDPAERRLGLAACLVHRVDPLAALPSALRADSPPLRADAARAAGELGRIDERATCLALAHDPDAAVSFAAARSAVLLGDRGTALDALLHTASAPGPLRDAALAVALPAADDPRARALLEHLAKARDDKQPATIRVLVRAVALAGDPFYMDWLVSLMKDPRFARLAGEAFTLVTGADLAALDLETRPPEETGAGPTDDPADAAVALDEDDGLPWPDPVRVETWWKANRQRFATGTRHLMGAPARSEHCARVLLEGLQRQRAVAALHRCLNAPGTVLFNIAAPAWRQRRLLTGD
jgi:uncharacterized protein (TIGR02270 family)